MPRSVVVQRVLGIVFALVFAAGAVWAFGRSAPREPEAGAASPSTQQPTSPPATPSTTDRPPPQTSPTGIATSGPGLSEPGIHVVAQAGADGSLEVLERVRLTAPATTLALALPRATGSGVTAARPTLTGFQAMVGGQVVSDTLAVPFPDAGDRLDLPVPSTDVTMRYRLEGGAERSQPAPVGRALVVLPPVTADVPSLAGLPVVVEVIGGNIRNLVCPDLDASELLCGRQQGSRWTTAPIPLGRSLVVAQIDLPPPGQQ
jgi:hypothetical protein